MFKQTNKTDWRTKSYIEAAAVFCLNIRVMQSHPESHRVIQSHTDSNRANIVKQSKAFILSHTEAQRVIHSHKESHWVIKSYKRVIKSHAESYRGLERNTESWRVIHTLSHSSILQSQTVIQIYTDLYRIIERYKARVVKQILSLLFSTSSLTSLSSSIMIVKLCTGVDTALCLCWVQCCYHPTYYSHPRHPVIIP